MKLKYFSILILIAFSNPNSTSANILTPPKLGDVIIKNEQLLKVQPQKVQRNKGKIKAGTGIILPIHEILSYHTVQSGNAIMLSKYDTIDLWVQEINLAKGGRLESFLTLGGYDDVSGEPLFEKKKLSEIQNITHSSAFSIINGQFFDPKKSLTPLSFGVKVDGVIRTAGADNRNESKNILIIEKEKAKVVPYSWENLRDAPGYFAMVNLSLETSHYRDEYIGRTYMCLKNPNSQNESSTVLIFTAVSITEPNLETELIRWGCTKDSVSKLDSSGSTRLSISGKNIFGYSRNGSPDYRKIPHSIVIYDSSI